ncbi:MAG: helix-turn-helix domain-containing protein [Firmicutes bacterium]|nr:helix-turn-helix domain-containing protein [Bacillota bacterium]
MIVNAQANEYVQFGKRLQKLRDAQGLSQKALAEKFGMAQQTYQGYESGNRKVTLQLLQQFADYFNVSIDYLAGKTGDFQYTEATEPPILTIPDVFKDVSVAFHQGDFEDLSQEEVDKLAEFARFIKSQRGG